MSDSTNNEQKTKKRGNQELTEQKREIKKREIKQEEEVKIQEEYQCWLVSSFHMIQATTGCGSRGQRFIDKAHQALKKFATEYASMVHTKTFNASRGSMKGFVRNRLANIYM